MPFDRREFFAASLAATGAAFSESLAKAQPAAASAPTKSSMPGPYPGRVVAVHHPNSIVSGQYQAEPVKEMIDRGLMELTHADSSAAAWKEFFQPGDRVGIKLNPVGRPAVISAPEVLHTIIAGLESAGIKRKDMLVYDRYGQEFQQAGFVAWLPEGVNWTSGSPVSPKIQLDMGGYDPDVYMELPLIHPDYTSEYNINDPHLRRSYVAKFITQQVDKVVNLSCLKHHQSAGVTLSLKNMSHGFVNNVSRSHVTTTANACGIFIPASVSLPVIRQKVVLHIIDGVKAAYHGGPGRTVAKYTWEHKTMYFGTDPVALDKTGWKEIDKKRAEVGVPSIALLKPDKDSRWLNCQVEHIELAGNLGLGVFDDEKIRVKRVELA